MTSPIIFLEILNSMRENIEPEATSKLVNVLINSHSKRFVELVHQKGLELFQQSNSEILSAFNTIQILENHKIFG